MWKNLLRMGYRRLEFQNLSLKFGYPRFPLFDCSQRLFD
jgi:hypothetical protein